MGENTLKFTSDLTTVCVSSVKIAVVPWFSLLIRCLISCLRKDALFHVFVLLKGNAGNTLIWLHFNEFHPITSESVGSTYNRPVLWS